MASVTTPAILLRSYPYSETSRVLRFYARSLGLVSVMARGVRKGASKGRGATATFGEGVAVIAVRETRELQSLREFSPSKVRFGLAADLRRLAGASMAAELVLRHAEPEPQPRLYDLLSAGLDKLAAAPSEALEGEILALVWSVVQVFGFGPELSACTACGTVLGDDEMARFDLESGGTTCSACGAPEGSRRVGPVARNQLRLLLEGQVPNDLSSRRAHLSLLDDFVTFHLLGGKRPASFQFLHQDRDRPSRHA